jgi:hypothetical protein
MLSPKIGIHLAESLVTTGSGGGASAARTGNAETRRRSPARQAERCFMVGLS